MLKETIKYTDFSGNEQEETHYFFISRKNAVKMEMSFKGGLSEHLKEIVASEDGGAIIEAFEDIIFSAYGERSEDGKSFRQSPELSQAFSQTAAYDELFYKLVTDADYAAKFVNGILPSDLSRAGDEKAIKAPQDKKPKKS